MCNVNCRKKRVGDMVLSIVRKLGVHRMEMKIKTCNTSPNPHTEKTTNEKKFFDDPGELFRPSVCCKYIGMGDFVQ